MIDADKDARQRVGVVGGFEGMQAMDTMLEMICKICARSPDMPAPWDDAEVEADSR